MTESNWQPLTPDELARVFAAAGFPWWIAGGYAIELAVGHPLRAHGDIDVLVLRRDHVAVRRLLADWDCHAADPPGHLRPWPVGEVLGAHVHDIWCRPDESQPWSIQLMIDEADGNIWRSRRHPEVVMPLSDLTRQTTHGLPYLAPEVQLFYKAKRRRPRDEHDFDSVLQAGVTMDVEWLSAAIAADNDDTHPWLERLTTGNPKSPG